MEIGKAKKDAKSFSKIHKQIGKTVKVHDLVGTKTA